MDFILATFLASILLLVYWLTNGKPRGMPPGPTGLPLLGYLFLGQRPFITMMDLSKKYGPVFTLPMFNRHAVVLNDWTSIEEALVKQSEIFNGRPPTLMSDVILHRTDIIFTGGPEWRQRRRFTLHHLKEFGFGQKSMEGVIMEEVHKLLERTQQMVHQNVDVSEFYFLSFLNVIWTMVSSKRFELEDPAMLKFTEMVDSIFEGATPNLSQLTPVLRHLPGSGYRKFYKANEKMNAFLKEEVDQHLATYQEGQARDFIDVYLAEIKAQEQKGQSPSAEMSFERKYLNSIIWDLCLAGVETGSSTLMWGLLYMITWPEIQKKVQEELDTIIGRVRLPTFQDSKVLPYTEAVLQEIQRYASLAPLSIFHYTLAEAKLGPYTIPKSTTIIENIWAVHHDPKCWGDPDVFRPERFLNDEGKAQTPKYLIPFSVGGRECLGKPLGKMEIFLFFTCLLHRFSFARVPGEEPPSLEPQCRITLKPKPYRMVIECR